MLNKNMTRKIGFQKEITQLAAILENGGQMKMFCRIFCNLHLN